MESGPGRAGAPHGKLHALALAAGAGATVSAESCTDTRHVRRPIDRVAGARHHPLDGGRRGTALRGGHAHRLRQGGWPLGLAGEGEHVGLRRPWHRHRLAGGGGTAARVVATREPSPAVRRSADRAVRCEDGRSASAPRSREADRRPCLSLESGADKRRHGSAACVCGHDRSRGRRHPVAYGVHAAGLPPRREAHGGGELCSLSHGEVGRRRLLRRRDDPCL